jgi:hypothetical protein
MKKEEFEKLHGRLPPETVYIDLDEQDFQETVTAGYTDTQLRNKSLESFDAEIASGELGLANLEETVAAERQRIAGLRQARARKLVLKP